MPRNGGVSSIRVKSYARALAGLVAGLPLALTLTL
jgi:hypothetical protein